MLPRIQESTQSEIIKLRREGLDIKSIAKIVGVSAGTVCKYCKLAKIETTSYGLPIRCWKVYVLLDPERLVHVVEPLDLIEFCRQNNLSHFGVRDIRRGRQYSTSGGWILLSTQTTPDQFKGQRLHNFSFANPSDQKFSGNNLPTFCKEHGLDYTSMRRLRKGKINCYKGWIRWTDVDRRIDVDRKYNLKNFTLSKEQSVLLLSQMKNVKFRALEYCSGQMHLFEDMFQFILLRLARAAFLYKEKGAASFRTYTRKWIHGAAMEFFREYRRDGISLRSCIKYAAAGDDFVSAKLVRDKQEIGSAMTNSTLPATPANPQGETQANTTIVQQKRLRFKRG